MAGPSAIMESIILIISTRPAYFHDVQRTKLNQAAEQAGFEVFKVINEPTAAAVFYSHRCSKTQIQDKYL